MWTPDQIQQHATSLDRHITALAAETARLRAALTACVNLLQQTADLQGGTRWLREWGARDTLQQARRALAGEET